MKLLCRQFESRTKTIKLQLTNRYAAKSELDYP